MSGNPPILAIHPVGLITDAIWSGPAGFTAPNAATKWRAALGIPAALVVGRGTGGVEKTPMAWRQWLDAWGEPRVREYLAQYRPDLMAVFEGMLPRVHEAPVRKPRKGAAERYAAARAATAERRAKNIPTPSQLLRVKPFDEEETRPLDLGSLRNVRAEYRTAPEQSRRVPCPSFGTVPVGVCIDDWTRTAARMRSQAGRKECLGCALGESRRQEYAGPVVEDEL